jgi:small subunit ribosomal protein S9
MAESTIKTKDRYVEGIGRRKTSVARARLTETSKASYVINDKDIADHFKTEELRKIATQAFETAGTAIKYKVSVRVSGGGVASQAVAVRHAISRALNEIDEAAFRPALKKAGFLKRDPRAKERRKFGLKKARKAPQWSKR